MRFWFKLAAAIGIAFILSAIMAGSYRYRAAEARILSNARRPSLGQSNEEIRAELKEEKKSADTVADFMEHLIRPWRSKPQDQ